MMMLSKLKIGLAVLLSSGLVAGSGMLAAQGPGTKPADINKNGDAKPDAVLDSQKEKALLARANLVLLGQSRIDMARKRLETQMAFYKEGRITIDRLLNASQTLLDAEMDVTDAHEARIGLIKAHLDRVKEIEKHELAELEVGRATLGDVEEVQTHRLEVQFRLAKEAEAADRKPSKPTVPPRAEVKRDIGQERVEIARRIHRDAQRLFSTGEISSAEVLEASRTLLEAERGAARTKAGRVAAVQGQVDILKKIVAAKEDQAKKGQVSRLEVDRAQLQLLDAESLLIEESSKPEGPGEAATPAPNGPLPVLRPGASNPTDARPLSPLAAAIEAFNADAARDEIGRDQPPLTEDEVVAAIRYYEFEYSEFEETLKTKNFALRPRPQTDEYFDEFRQIAVTRRLPPGAEIEVVGMIDPGGDFLYYGWWVKIELSEESGKRGRTYTFPIRSRLIRSTSIQEELKKAEDHVRLATPRDLRMEERVRELRARIERRKTRER